MSNSVATSRLGRELWPSVQQTRHLYPQARGFLRQPNPLQRFNHRQIDNNALRQQFCSWERFSQDPPPWRQLSHYTRRSYRGGDNLLLLRTGSTSPRLALSSHAGPAQLVVSANLVQKAYVSHGRQARERTARCPNVMPGDRRLFTGKRDEGSTSAGETGKSGATPQADHGVPRQKTTSSSEPPESQSLADSVSKLLHLPKMPTRPTKEELLAAANGFWQRLRVRFKWFSIRSMRPWNIDEWGAFVSWFLFGHLVWILVGTTTFFSLLIFTINTVVAQEKLARWVGDYLTRFAGITVVFESAIVPKWKDGVISFKNVFVSRRPGQVTSTVNKGSSNQAAEAAAARQAGQDVEQVEIDDGNYTQFDVTIKTVNVTLSFVKWWNGRGLLKDVEVKGVRGIIDRTSVDWTTDGKDPLAFRHPRQPGDFELDYFKMEDLLVTVHQPKGFRPFAISIFSCELPQLRRQWLFYDFLSANHMSGSYDGSLFTIHPRQIHNVPAADDDGTNDEGERGVWKKFSRLRIDGLKIDHLNRGIEGPFGWIYEGNVDIVADVMFPDEDEEGFGKVMAEFYDKMEEAVTSNRYIQMLESNGALNGASEIINNTFDDQGALPQGHDIASGSKGQPTQPGAPEEQPRGYLIMDMRIHLNDVRAAVPLFSKPHIGYVNQALVRPMVAYINAKRTYIPITCRIVKRHTDFDGAWTVWESRLMDDLSAEVYTAFARDVEDQHNRVRRFKLVGLWTLSQVALALLAGVAGDLM